MNQRLMRVAALGVVGSAYFLLGNSRAQERNVRANPPTAEIQVSPFDGPAVFYWSGAGSAAQSDIARLMKELRDTDDAAKKADLTKQLDTAVAKYFDDDMKAREEELTKLEERLNKLRAQLDRRRRAKAEIIQLQIKVLVNEAEGLGFSGASFFDTGRPVPHPAGGMGAGRRVVHGS